MTTESENIETARRYLRAIEEGVAFDELASIYTPDVFNTNTQTNTFGSAPSVAFKSCARVLSVEDVLSHRSVTRYVTWWPAATG